MGVAIITHNGCDIDRLRHVTYVYGYAENAEMAQLVFNFELDHFGIRASFWSLLYSTDR